MRIKILIIYTILVAQALAQEGTKYHSFNIGTNVISGLFKNSELNLEFMLNKRLGVTSDLGYQFLTTAGDNLNLIQNNIEGYYGKIGPRLYFNDHDSRVSGYLSAGYIYSFFRQHANINENDFYEPTNFEFSTQQRLDGSYLGWGTLIKLPSRFCIDLGAIFNFYSPKSINFIQDYNNATNAQPGFGNMIMRNRNNFGMGIGLNCSIKYFLIQHRNQ
jgi:hypothetical protein